MISWNCGNTNSICAHLKTHDGPYIAHVNDRIHHLLPQWKSLWFLMVMRNPVASALLSAFGFCYAVLGWYFFQILREIHTLVDSVEDRYCSRWVLIS